MFCMPRFYFLSVLAAVFASATHATPHKYFIPGTVQNGTSYAQFISSAMSLDAPKVHPINPSTFDWWYFDVVSANSTDLSSVIVIFFTSPQSAFPLLAPSDSITTAYIYVSFPNGTLWSAVASADSATVETKGDGASGTWHGTGFSWTGSLSDGSGYLVSINAPDVGVTGTINFAPTAPAHYPCGRVATNDTLEIAPGIGWANAIPDAVSVVNLSVDSTELAFTGSGYHDKGNQVFTSLFDFLDRAGTEAVSAYIAKDNEILAASCTLGSISVRPSGQNATYPPLVSTGNPSGYHIEVDLGQDGTLTADVEVSGNLIEANPEYGRFVGKITGEEVALDGMVTTGLVGMALFEQFKLIS
ncbi:hypothetical protein C8R45DRAFT_1184337 [Mycena sanguinolenta]|nr:hypothetical protein C8R45DRAFT_1184337 [Mycena sanguinolenta]